jgi:CBS domain containing-hemolysin-like protein
VERIDEDTIRIDGTFPIDDFNEQFDCDLPDEDYHTVAGFVFGELGRTAEPGDEVRHEGLLFRVDSVEGQRIDRLMVTFQPWRRPEQQEDDDAAA